MRILVTGGCGFIGQGLTLRLAAAHRTGHVQVLDARTSAATGWDEVCALGVEVVEGMVQDAGLVTRLVGELPDVVIHLAAQSHVDVSLEAPHATWMSNAIGTQVVARACADFGVPLVYCSTDEVYGSTPRDSDGNPVAVGETARLAPSSPYSASKAAGEHAVRSMGHSAGLRYIITRGNNAWGLNQLSEKLVPLACAALAQGSAVPLHGGGHSVRQWVSAGEFADALHRVALGLAAGKHAGKTYNIAGPDLMSVRELVLAFADIAGVPHEQAVWDSEERPGQDSIYFTSGAALLHDFGFRATRKLSDPSEQRMLLAHYANRSVSPMLASYVSQPPRAR